MKLAAALLTLLASAEAKRFGHHVQNVLDDHGVSNLQGEDTPSVQHFFKVGLAKFLVF
jgi:hypothetical protein